MSAPLEVELFLGVVGIGRIECRGVFEVLLVGRARNLERVEKFVGLFVWQRLVDRRQGHEPHRALVVQSLGQHVGQLINEANETRRVLAERDLDEWIAARTVEETRPQVLNAGSNDIADALRFAVAIFCGSVFGDLVLGHDPSWPLFNGYWPEA